MERLGLRKGAIVGVGLVVLVVLVAAWRFGARSQPERSIADVGDVTSTAASAASSPSGAASEGGRGDARWFVDEHAATIALAGRVFRDGEPARATEVVLSDELTSEGLLAPRRVTTTDDGRFTFPRLPRIRGAYRLTARGEGLAPAWAIAPGDASKHDLELRLQTCKMHVYGTVSDASGGAVAGAAVFLEKVPEHRTTADARGEFTLCMGPRTGRLRVEAEGYGGWSKWVQPRGAVRQDVTLVPAASLHGNVVAEDGATAVPFALVGLRASGELVREVESDAEGRFAMGRIAAGVYGVEARAPGAKTKAPVEVAVFASGRATVTVPLERRARVRGQVVAAGKPVPRAVVNLGFAGTYEHATAVRTDDAGAFAVDDVPIGNVLVRVDEWEVEAPKTLRVPERGLDGVTLEVSEKGTLDVTVTRAGKPVADATVFLRGAAASDTKLTNAAGVAAFKGVSDGEARVVAEQGIDFAVAEHVQIARNRPKAIDLDLGAGRQIAGRVIDERGAPVDGARIVFTPMGSAEDLGASAVSGPDGTFQGGPLRGPATYRAKVTRSGVALTSKGEPPALVVPASGPASPPNLTLVVGAQDKDVRGVVLDTAGGPVPDARVTVSRPERHSEILATTFTGNDGAFAVRGLGEGPYAVKAAAVSGAEAEVKPLTLPSAPLRVVLPEVGAIHGTLSGFARTPSVMAWSVVGYEHDFHVAVIEGARFTIRGLSRGKYHVAATTPEGAAQQTVEIVGGAAVEVALAASTRRTIRGRALDFRGGGPLPGLRCQAAPMIDGARSPVIVPGDVFTDAQGAFELVDVPSSDLYMWCLGDASYRGGVARLPADLGAAPVTVWGLDARGKPALDTRVLAMTFDDDHPFSRLVTAVEPKGAAERAGVRAGDVFESVGGRAMTECGNGVVRHWLALRATEDKTVPIVVSRAGSPVPLAFRLAP